MYSSIYQREHLFHIDCTGKKPGHEIAVLASSLHCGFLYVTVAAELSSFAEIQTGPHDQSVKQVEHGRQEAFASPACLKKRNLL